MTPRGCASSAARRPSSSAGAGASCVRGPGHPRPLAGAPAAAGLLLGQRRVEHERLAQREVEVHRAGAAVERGPERAAGELAQPAHALGRGGVVVDLEVPLGRAAVELDLVDRLPGAELAQLGRAVGGQHEQRHARLVGLDHRGRVVGRRGPRRAGERDRHARRLREPEREEAAAALVDVRGRADARLAGEREHERGRARARRGAGLAQAAARELVDEGAQAEVGVGGWHRLRGRARRPGPPPRLHADRRELGRGGAASWRDATARWRPTWAPGRGRPSSTASRRSRRRRFALARLLDGRAARAGARAAGAGAGASGSCSSPRARGSPTAASAPRGATPTPRWRTGSRRSGWRRSRASGRRSRCSPASRAAVAAAAHADRLRRTRGRARRAAARARHRRDAAAVGPPRRAGDAGDARRGGARREVRARSRSACASGCRPPSSWSCRAPGMPCALEAPAAVAAVLGTHPAVP